MILFWLHTVISLPLQWFASSITMTPHVSLGPTPPIVTDRQLWIVSFNCSSSEGSIHCSNSQIDSWWWVFI